MVVVVLRWLLVVEEERKACWKFAFGDAALEVGGTRAAPVIETPPSIGWGWLAGGLQLLHR